nr:MAG TPA: hypothetical protein [Caudoviricetes sp.]
MNVSVTTKKRDSSPFFYFIEFYSSNSIHRT